MAQPATDTATTDAANEPAANGETPESHAAKPPTRLVLVRHGVTAHTGPLLSGRMPGIDLSEKGIESGRGRGRPARRAHHLHGVREPDRAHHADRLLHRGPPRTRGAAAARRDRGRLRRLDRRQDRRARQDRRVEGRAGRAVRARVPRRRVAARDAVAHGRRARRGRGRAPERDRGRGEPRRPDQVGDRALHGHAPRPVPAPAREPRVGHGARLPRLRRAAREVQRHRRARRSRTGPGSGPPSPSPSRAS